MTAETKERLLKGGISVASLVAAYGLVGYAGPLKDLVTIGAGVAGNWLAQFSSEAVMPIIKEKWLTNTNPQINHHVERALKAALDCALDDVRTRYIDQQGSVSTREEQSLVDFTNTLKERGAQAFVDDVRRAMDQADVFQYIAANPTDVGQLLDKQVQIAELLDPFSDDFYLTPDFIAFFKQHLPERMQFWFREKLKEGTEAKQAVDLLYFETLRTMLETLVQEQSARRKLLDQLHQQAEANHQTIEFYGEIWLSAIRQFRSQFDQLLDNDQQILQELRALGIDLGDVKRQLLNRSAADAHVNLPADVQYQRLSNTLQQLTANLAAKQQKAEKLTAHLRTDLDPDLREELQEKLSDVNQTLLQLGTERADTEAALKDHVAGVLRLANLLGRADDGSERFQQARTLFKQGRIADVIALIDEDAIRRERDAERKKLSEATNRLKQLAQELLIKAEAIALDKTKSDWFAQASTRYHEAVATSDEPEILFAVAYFFSNHNEFKLASFYYEQTLSACRRLCQLNPQTYRSNLAGTLNNLGNLQSNSGQLSQAQLSYEEALAVYRELAQLNPQIYRSNVAGTLNNLGNLQRKTGQLSQAQLSYEEALAVYRELAQLNPQTYRSNVATTLNNLGNLQSNSGQLSQAQLSYEEALAIYRELAQLNPQTYRPDVAMTLNNLGLLQSNSGQLSQAQLNYEEALATFRELAQPNPQTYRPYMVGTLNNLGLLQSNSGQLSQAQLSYEEALAIRRQLVQLNSQAYSVDLATTLASLGLFYYEDLPNRDLSISHIHEALSIALPSQGQLIMADQVIDLCFRVLLQWDENP